MTICWELGFTGVVFEGDCSRVVIAAKTAFPAEDDLCPIIYDVHHMHLQAQDWSIQYSHRSTNRVAQNLAKLACNVTSDHILIEEYHTPLDDVIQLDKLCMDPIS